MAGYALVRSQAPLFGFRDYLGESNKADYTGSFLSFVRFEAFRDGHLYPLVTLIVFEMLEHFFVFYKYSNAIRIVTFRNPRVHFFEVRLNG